MSGGRNNKEIQILIRLRRTLNEKFTMLLSWTPKLAISTSLPLKRLATNLMADPYQQWEDYEAVVRKSRGRASTRGAGE